MLFLLLFLASLPASLQLTCDLMKMGKVNPVTDLIDSTLPNLGLCARGPGWSKRGRLRLTSSRHQGNRRVPGENFNQVWWISLVKRPGCVTRLSIFVNGVELRSLTEAREPLVYQSPIPTTRITLRLFYKNPIPTFPDKCLEVSVLLGRPENNRRQDQGEVEARYDGPKAEHNDGPAEHSSKYLLPPGPRSSGGEFNPPQQEGSYPPPHPNLRPPPKEFFNPPGSYDQVRRPRRLFPTEAKAGHGSSVEDFGPTMGRDADAVNFPQPPRKPLPPTLPPFETSSVRVDNPPNVVRANFPSNRAQENVDSSHEKGSAVDIEIVMGGGGVIAFVVVAVLTLGVRRMKRARAPDPVNSGKGEVWSSKDSKRRKQEKYSQEEYFVDNNYENGNNDELYENDNVYQNT